MKLGVWKLGLVVLVVLLLTIAMTAISWAEEADASSKLVIQQLPDSWSAGRDIVLDFSECDNSYYQVEVFRLTEEDEELVENTGIHVYPNFDLTLVIDGWHLTEGQYEIKIKNYQGSESVSKELTISGSMEKGPDLTVPVDSFINSNVRFSHNLSNANKVLVRYYHLDYGDEADILENYADENVYNDTEATAWERSFSRQGKFAVRATVRIGDRWTAWSDPQEFTLDSKGALATPTFSVVESQVGAYIIVELDEAIDHATKYSFSLYRYNPDGGWLEFLSDRWSFDWVGAYTLLYNGPDDLLYPGKYYISCYASADGYETSCESVDYNVIGDVTIPTFAIEKTNYLRGETIAIKLPQRVDTARLQIGKYYEMFDEIAYDEGEYYYNCSELYHASNELKGTYYVRVQTQRANTWTPWSEAKAITVETKGIVASPTDIRIADKVPGTMPSELTAYIHNVSEQLSVYIGEVGHAERITVTLESEQGDWIDERVSSSGGYFDFNTTLLDVGKYKVIIEMSARGYDPCKLEYSFTVTGEQKSPPSVTVSATSARRGETIQFVVSEPKATKFRLLIGKWAYEVYTAVNGKAVIDVNPWYWMDSYAFSAFVDGEWTAVSDRFDILLIDDSDEYGLEKPKVSIAQDEITTTSGMTITIEPVENAEYGIAMIQQKSTPVPGYAWIQRDLSLSEKQIISIPAEVLSTPGDYYLMVYAFAGKGSFNKDTIIDFTVSGEEIIAEQPSFVLDELNEINVGKPFTFNVTANGKISNICARYTRPDRVNAYGRMTIPFENISENTVKATLLFEDESSIGYSEIQFMFKINGDWTEYTRPYAFIIKDGYGVIRPSVPQLSSQTVTIGERIRVNFDSVAHAADYQVAASQDGRNWVYFDFDEEDYYIIDTAKLSEGRWIAKVIITPEEGYQCSDVETYAIFYVMPAKTSSLTTLTLPSALTTIESQAFYGTIAEKVVISGKCTTIGSQAFAFAPNLTVVVIPESVTGIAADAFTGCGGLTIQTTSTSTVAYRFATEMGIPVAVVK